MAMLLPGLPPTAILFAAGFDFSFRFSELKTVCLLLYNPQCEVILVVFVVI